MRTVSLHKLVLGAFLLAEVGFLILLAGCGATFDYDGLRKTETGGDGFNAALAREYKDFALFEADEMKDWPDAAHFGEKSLAAGAGVQTPPEDPKNWNLPEANRGEIAESRARLMLALQQGADVRWPETAAKAQAKLDCWIEQQEENWQTWDIARCREAFQAAMNEIEQGFAVSEAAADNDLVAATPAVKPAAPEEPEPVAAAPSRFLVLFDFDSARLAPETAPILDAIAGAAGGSENVSVTGVKSMPIEVSGHADRAGTEDYNMRLSFQRAETVGQALIERGVDSGRIRLSAHGETDPLIDTDDGVREPRNRRVEVVVGSVAAP